MKQKHADPEESKATAPSGGKSTRPPGGPEAAGSLSSIRHVFHVPMGCFNKENNMLKALLPFLTNLPARAIPLAAAVALAGIATAQNLVNNPSFEDTVDCEVGTQCLLLKASGWYNPNSATPDVWDCDLVRDCGFSMDPNDPDMQASGYQESFDGLRHAGAFYWYGPGSSNTREYLMTKLNEPLVSGNAYQVGLYYSRPEGFSWATDHIGVWLGIDSIWENTPDWLHVEPQVKLRDPNSPYLIEGAAWVQLVDTLFASGGEEWVVIGNFDVADSVVGIYVNPGLNYAYYYIDQVSVRLLPEVMAVPDEGIRAWWVGDGLSIRYPASFQPSEVSIHDASGKAVFEARFSRSGSFRLDVPVLAPGFYVVRAADGQHALTGRFVKGE
ncbi:MAG: T9SS type A sorting domain-containing protein [Flavobacteriales bacterium]|nr:T9SS type A sorting domain-containing protein [Flavobacteriales bacterium]MBK7086207.1 T9SS type A sorting domain-containing protein [Flavobacteriales bacterium]MBK9074551.1 T9SS type A sorting domain-containing protein [Flavobacteriales bacterium]